jgi:hypothetical protein
MAFIYNPPEIHGDEVNCLMLARTPVVWEGLSCKADPDFGYLICDLVIAQDSQSIHPTPPH